MPRYGDHERKSREAFQQHHGRVRGRVKYALRRLLGRGDR